MPIGSQILGFFSFPATHPLIGPLLPSNKCFCEENTKRYLEEFHCLIFSVFLLRTSVAKDYGCQCCLTGGFLF